MESSEGEGIFDGLTQLQKDQVYEWINEFRLSPQELAAWREDREVFVKAVKYKTPVETPADFICRDIYELKLFGVRVADFFHKNGEPAFLKICGRVFTREEAMRWVLIKSHLKKPFAFSKGEPQGILNSLGSDTRSIRKRTHVESEEYGIDKGQNTLSIVSVVGGVKLTTPRNDDDLMQAIGTADEKPTQKELDQAATEFARKNLTHTQSVSASLVDERICPRTAGIAVPTAFTNADSGTRGATVPSRTDTAEYTIPPIRSSREAAPDNKQDCAKTFDGSTTIPPSGRSLARSCKVQTTNAQEARIKLPPTNPTPVRTGVTNTSPFVSESPRSSRPKGPGRTVVTTTATLSQGIPPSCCDVDRTLRAGQPQSQSPLATIQQPVNYLVPVNCENVALPGQPIYSISTDATVRTSHPISAPPPAQDSSSKAYQAMVDIYLRQFKVDVSDFSNWLMDTFGSNSVPQGELFARADHFLTTIENTLWELEKQPTPDATTIASAAELIGVSKQSLEKWNSPEIRPLFHTDKTALKYDLFQRVFARVDDEKRSYLPQAEEVIRYRTRSDFATANRRRGKPHKLGVDLVRNLLDFFSLEPNVLDELPLEGNRRFREKLRKDPSIHTVQILLDELGILISHRNEVSMFSNLFSAQDAAFCFEMPVVRIPPSDNMFHVSIEDAMKAVTSDRRLRSSIQEESKDFDAKKIRNVLDKYGKSA